MALTAQQMVQRINDRTSYKNDKKIVGELASAADWCYNKVFNSAEGPDQFLVPGEEISIAARTRTYDLGAAVTAGNLYGVKLLWLKLGADTTFSPMQPLDMNDPRFIVLDSILVSDTTTVATGHPVYYDFIDFSEVRFAPPLPAGSTLRVDYWIKPNAPDPSASAGTHDALEPTHEAIVDKATAQIFSLLSDDRALEWERRAQERIQDALHVIQKRHQGPTTTRPFRSNHRRLV